MNNLKELLKKVGVFLYIVFVIWPIQAFVEIKDWVKKLFKKV